MTVYSGPTAENLDHIPDELKACAQWLLWRGEDRIDTHTGKAKLNKIPIDPQTLRNASTTDPQTWGTFERCVAALPVALEEWEHANPGAYRGGGIGFVFTSADPYCGVDLDHCRDPDTGEIAAWAQSIIDTLASYTEVTPSTTGVHVLMQGTLDTGRKKGAIEMYSSARYFTMTGWHLPESPLALEDRQEVLTALYLDVFGPPSQATHQNGTAHQASPRLLLDDAVLLDKARAAKNNGPKVTALWSGDLTGYPSPSEADLALSIRLAFWTRDTAQIDRLFRQSGLMRDKWDETHGAQTYGERTIAKALELQREHYTPAQGANISDNSPDTPSADPRPVIKLTPGVDIKATVDTAQQAILACPGEPRLYQRARVLCRIVRGVKPPKWLKRALDAPVIVDANLPYLRELSQQAAQWWRYDKRGKSWDEAHPPDWFLETLADRKDWTFPVLEGVITAPTIRPDGSVLDKPGYDPDTALYLDFNGVTFPVLPAHPTLDDARSAIGALQEPLCDFLFVEVNGNRFHYPFAAALAAILSLACRSAIQGNVPLFAATSTTPGSGKGLLVDVLSIIGTGRPAPRWPQSDDDAEDRKRLLTVGMAGDPCIHIDNVLYPLGSPALDLALTAPSVKDRLMGKNIEVDAPLNMVWFASGNNLQYKGDLARRVVPLPLDPQMERPEERDVNKFRYNPLLPWVQAQRPRLLIAALTIVKAYFDAGCKRQGLPAFGSFQEWADLVRSCLVWAGEADCCEGRKDLVAQNDPDMQKLATLLECWQSCYPTREPVTLKHVLQDIRQNAQHIGPETTANQWNDLQDALGSLYLRYDGKSLSNDASDAIGCKLRAWERRVIDGKRFVRDGKHRHAIKWLLDVL